MPKIFRKCLLKKIYETVCILRLLFDMVVRQHVERQSEKCDIGPKCN